MSAKVLVVVDRVDPLGFGFSYGQPDPKDEDYFSFSHLLDALSAYADFTKAHRQTDPISDKGSPSPADIENFRFDTVDLSVYAQIWLVGYNSLRPEPPNENSSMVLSQAELAAVSSFMNAGGGIYATGDHAGLGLSLAGRLPRVRSMRKWWFPTAGPLGEPTAPPAVTSERLDTTQYGFNDPPGAVFFDNQSDDIPQSISPWGGTANLCYANPHSLFSPHPLLQGSQGLISQIADHMHEGEVILPWKYNQKFSFNGGPQFDEYPAGPNGVVKPQIIAWAWTNGVKNVVPPAETGVHVGDDNISTPYIFGAIGAYDGFLANVGRVVVESTWHHFLDINLIGDPMAPAPKDKGFNATPEGKLILKGIEEFYRNVIYWLSPPQMAFEHWMTAVVKAVRRQSVVEVLSSMPPDAAVISVGRVVAGVLRHSASVGMLTSWLLSALPKEIREVMPATPWGPTSGTPGCGGVDHERVVHAALGGAAIAAYGLNRQKGREALANNTLARKEIALGTLNGISTVAGELKHQGEGLLRLERAIRQNSKYAYELWQDEKHSPR